MRRSCGLLLALALAPILAHAQASVGFDGTMGGAALGFTNTSTSALVTHTTLTIGDTVFSYDSVNIADGGGHGVTLISPDRTQGGVTTKLFDIAFSTFDPNGTVNFPFDIDPDADPTAGCCPVSGVLINNDNSGPTPNAVLTVTFSTGDVIALTLPDTQGAPDDPFTNPSACISSLSCTFSASTPVVDTDGDGRSDAADNCPNLANPGWADSGGVGAGSPPDGIGDACQCGDVDGDGLVTGLDGTFIRRAALNLAPYTTGVGALPGPLKCDTTGGSGGDPIYRCNGLDGTLVQRAALGLAPGIQQSCPAATGN